MRGGSLRLLSAIQCAVCEPEEGATESKHVTSTASVSGTDPVLIFHSCPKTDEKCIPYAMMLVIVAFVNFLVLALSVAKYSWV